jgi:hypothetical protein
MRPLPGANHRHLLPTPKVPAVISATPDLSGLLTSLHLAQHVLEMFRRTLPAGTHRRLLDRLANRLTKIVSEARALNRS